MQITYNIIIIHDNLYSNNHFEFGAKYRNILQELLFRVKLFLLIYNIYNKITFEPGKKPKRQLIQ